MSTSGKLPGGVTAKRRLLFGLVGGAGLGMAVLGLSSCAGGDAGPASPVVGMGGNGSVMGGRQPINGAVVSIYAAGNPTPLLTLPPTGADGRFSFTSSQVRCPSDAKTPVYFVATGGDAGGGVNSAIALSAGIASCDLLADTSFFVNIDEVTTVASVWALSQFLDSTAQTLVVPTDLTGVKNAAQTVANLADTVKGVAVTALEGGATGTPPAAAVNTLANILATCVNSGGPTSSPCVNLFTAATAPVSGTAPTTTLEAALNIARNPGSNVAAVWALSPSDGPFQTPLPSAPGDWTLSVSFPLVGTGVFGSRMSLSSIAIDDQGDLWISSGNDDGTVNEGHGFVAEISPQGVPVTVATGAGYVFTPRSIAIDQQGQIWVVNGASPGTFNNTAGSVLRIDPSTLDSTPYAGDAALPLASPLQVTVDSSGNIWSVVARAVTKLATGTYTATAYDLSQINGANSTSLTSIAADSYGNVWLASALSLFPQILELPAGYPGSDLVFFQGGYDTNSNGFLAVDLNGNIWNPIKTGGGVNLLTRTAEGGYGGTHVGITADLLQVIAMDGAGYAWMFNRRPVGVRVLGPGGGTAPAFGGSSAQILSGATPPAAMAVDPSGNVWLAQPSALLKVVGAATPVKTPVIGNVQKP